MEYANQIQELLDAPIRCIRLCNHCCI